MIRVNHAPDGAFTSELYSVYAAGNRLSVYTALFSDGNGNYIPIPDELFKIYDGLEHVNKTVRTYFASFETDAETELRIEYEQEIKTVRIKPESLNKSFEFRDNALYLKICPGEYITLEINGEVFSSLSIFCNRLYEEDSSYKNIIEFSPGLHTKENSSCITENEHGIPIIGHIPDNTHIIIRSGAVVRAAIALSGAKNIKISGNGVLSLIDRCHGADKNFEGEMWGGFRRNALPSIYIKSGCRAITIEGITLNCEFRGITIRNSSDIHISDVKIFSSSVNADGINMMNVKNVLIEKSFIKSSDDCIALFTSCDSIPTLANSDYPSPESVSSNVEVRRCCLASYARIFMIGGHSTGNTNPRDVVENVSVHDCEIIDTLNRNKKPYEQRMYWSGILRVLSQTEQIVRNVSFRDLNVNWTRYYAGKLIHVEVRTAKDASYSESVGYRIENISFENIHCLHCPGNVMPSMFKADFSENEKDREINGITLKNITYNGHRIKNNENDILVSGNVKHLVLD